MYFIGIDVGTKSVRAALFTENGFLKATDVTEISIFNPESNFYEQNSEEIWNAVCSSVKKISQTIDPKSIYGIGFDATCSLVILDHNYMPVPVNKTADNSNVIMWMDHRAQSEAEFINSNPFEFLKYVGGKISVEMHTPKVLWLKNNLSESLKQGTHFFGLPDFLTFKATEELTRSICSLTCKWAYIPNKGFDEMFFEAVGLKDLLTGNPAKIGSTIKTPGKCVGKISSKASKELNLEKHTSVGVSLIDADAGALALVFSAVKHGYDPCEVLAMICGTSTCHLSLSKSPIFIPGLWGPYKDVILPNYWVLDGGQSASGSLLDHIVLNHSAAKFCPVGQDIFEWLENVLTDTLKYDLNQQNEAINCETETNLQNRTTNQQNNLQKETTNQQNEANQTSQSSRTDDENYKTDFHFDLSKNLHIYPDFYGNRSPLADSTMKGMICGLELSSTVEDLALLYLATIESLAYGTKSILETLKLHGKSITCVAVCGGLTKSKLFVQVNADVLGIPIYFPKNQECVLLGSAMLGAAASGKLGEVGDLEKVAGLMASDSNVFKPRFKTYGYHKKKYEIFKKMQQHQLEYKKIMNS